MKLRIGLTLLAIVLSGCGQAAQTEDSPTSSPDDELSEVEAPSIYALATDAQVASAQSVFSNCSRAVADLQASRTKSAGKAYNAAKVASAVCGTRIEDITFLRNGSKADFRISDCR